MNETKHTTGPWAIQPDGWVATIMDVEDGGDIICDRPSDAPDSMRRWEANARLIAAAPDMLEALRNTLSLLKVFTRETDDVAKACWDQAEAAIAKATGG